jgi:regulator of protease activity HflC (stomatin/prohibitin superfamily)
MAKRDEYSDGGPLLSERSRRWGSFFTRYLPSLSVGFLALLLSAVVLWPYMVITVPSGHVAVLWHRFLSFDTYCWCFTDRGTVLNPRELREEGLHVIMPWDKLFIYDLRLQSRPEVYHAISRDGVIVTAQINVRYQLLHDAVGVLHKFVGPDYFNTVVDPEIGSQARLIISEYTAQEVYTSRDKIQTQIRDTTQRTLADKLNKLVQPAAMEESDPQHYLDFMQDSILILDTLVLSIDLPPQIVAAINRQTEQYYAIQEAKYRVQREAAESQRKMIEANGIAAFQRTVSKGISDSYLRWQGINATLALAQSPNAKVVIIGSGKNGLPLILGNDTAATGPAAQPGPSASPPGAANESNAAASAPPSLSDNAFDGSEPAPASPLLGAGKTGTPTANDRSGAGSVSTSAGTKPLGSPSIGSGVDSLLSRLYGFVRPTEPSPSLQTETHSSPDREQGAR